MKLIDQNLPRRILLFFLSGLIFLPILVEAATETQPAVPQKTEAKRPLKVVLQVSVIGPEANMFALSNAQTLVDRAKAENRPLDLRIIIFGKAVVNFIRPDVLMMGRAVKQLQTNPDVHFAVSEKSLAHFNLNRSKVLPGFDIVPSGAYEVIRLEEEGYIYFKP